MTRPESAPGFTLWLTGLPGPGKTTVDEPVAPALELDTGLEEPQPCADQMIAFLESQGLAR